jgi:hypothetical protein
MPLLAQPRGTECRFRRRHRPTSSPIPSVDRAPLRRRLIGANPYLEKSIPPLYARGRPLQAVIIMRIVSKATRARRSENPRSRGSPGRRVCRGRIHPAAAPGLDQMTPSNRESDRIVGGQKRPPTEPKPWSLHSGAGLARWVGRGPTPARRVGMMRAPRECRPLKRPPFGGHFESASGGSTSAPGAAVESEPEAAR